MTKTVDGVCADCWAIKDEAALRLRPRPRPRTQPLLDADRDGLGIWVASALVAAVALGGLGTLILWIWD